MNTFFKKHSIQLVTVFIILVFSGIKIRLEEKPYATGDAIEYSLMTEALFNHFSPNVETGDWESFKRTFVKVNKWEENDKAGAYEAALKFISNNTYKTLEYDCAFFVSKEGKKYSVHFFFYSLLNIPVRWVCSIIPFNPLFVFQITNILLILISCFIIFKYSRFKKWETAAFVLLLFYSTNYWYLCWVHPEVFTVCFVTVGLWLFFQEKKYVGILFISIAALQNQPLAILSAILCFITLCLEGLNLKTIFKICLCSFLIFVPPLFYYYHFGESNLIKYQGALSFDYVTFTRVLGFFFDLNQGAILAIPFILLGYILIVIRKVVLIKTSTIKWDLLIPISIIAMVCIAGTINNWNHGQAVVNRYVTYISAVITVHFFFLIMNFKDSKKRNAILITAVLSQIATVFYHQTMSRFDWSTNQPKPIANWVLNHFPKFYNPDPVIFIERYAPGMIDNISESPAYYAKKNGEITKFLVHKNYLDNLEKYGFSNYQIDSLAPELNYITDWAYIDITESFHSNFTFNELKNIDNERKINRLINTIQKDAAWYESIKQKAKELQISDEDALRRDAAYILGIAGSDKNETKEEKIQNKINQIKASPNWLKLIETKANEQNILLDSALYNDARWMVEQEMKN